MSEGRIAITGLAIDNLTKLLQAQLCFVNGQWMASIPNLTERDRQYGCTEGQLIPLSVYLDSAKILFPPKKKPAED